MSEPRKRKRQLRCGLCGALLREGAQLMVVSYTGTNSDPNPGGYRYGEETRLNGPCPMCRRGVLTEDTDR